MGVQKAPPPVHTSLATMIKHMMSPGRSGIIGVNSPTVSCGGRHEADYVSGAGYSGSLRDNHRTDRMPETRAIWPGRHEVRAHPGREFHDGLGQR